MESPWRSWSNRLDKQQGLNAGWLWVVSLAGMALMALRRPGLFWNPDFYAEDLSTWYVQAYRDGWLHSFSITAGGYLNTLQRLLGGIALLVPFHDAPIVDAFSGLCVQAMPLPILLSARCRNWGPLSTRVIFSILYVFFPNGSEIHVVLTNSQWHFALAVVLLAFAKAPRRTLGRVTDAIIFTLAGLSGPFGFVILPCIFIYWYTIDRQPWHFFQAACLAPGIAIQAFFLLWHGSRYQAPLGASFGLFLNLMGSGVVTATALGAHTFETTLPLFVSGAAAVFGCVLLVYCCLYASAPLRFLVLVSALLVAAALHAPLISGDKPLWQALLANPISRYWFFPGLSLLWAAAWAMRSAQAGVVRWLGTGYLLVACAGMLVSYRYPPYAERHFARAAREFENARPGSSVIIPVLPDIQSEIVKR